MAIYIEFMAIDLIVCMVVSYMSLSSLCADLHLRGWRLHVGRRASLLHLVDWVGRLEVDLVDPALVDQDTVEVEFDCETWLVQRPFVSQPSCNW